MRREKIKNHTSWPLATDNPTLRLWVRGSAEDACCEQIFCLVASSLTREKNLIFPNFVTVEFYRGYWTVDDSCMSGAHYLSNGLLCMHVCLVTSNANDFSLFKSKTFAEFCFADFFFSKFLRIKCYFLSKKLKPEDIHATSRSLYIPCILCFKTFFLRLTSYQRTVDWLSGTVEDH